MNDGDFRVDTAVYRCAREDLEATVRAMRVRFLPREDAAERAAFPPMVPLYWRLTGGLFEPPCAQAAFATAVLDAAGGRVRGATPAGIEARARKAYPGFVRQHHMELMLRERFRHVAACADLDLGGLDFLVLDGGFACGLGLSLETPIARDWELTKARRNPPCSNLPVLHLHLELNRPRAMGQLELHPPADVDHFDAWMRRQRDGLLRQVEGVR